jgi:PTH1 family peptidyl-tRNA hydrolase
LKPRILLGLGNPGVEYENTPHNMGAACVRAWARMAGLGFVAGDGPFEWTPVRRGCRAVIPTTYMNLSGRAILKLLPAIRLTPEQVLVVADDVWLALGRLRLRTSGSDGGHNGLKSVAEALGTQSYPRLRIGVGPVPERVDWADYVLTPFTETLAGTIRTCVESTVAALDLILARGYGNAQNTINRAPDDTDEKKTEN